VIGIKGIEV